MDLISDMLLSSLEHNTTYTAVEAELRRWRRGTHVDRAFQTRLPCSVRQAIRLLCKSLGGVDMLRYDVCAGQRCGHVYRCASQALEFCPACGEPRFMPAADGSQRPRQTILWVSIRSFLQQRILGDPENRAFLGWHSSPARRAGDGDIMSDVYDGDVWQVSAGDIPHAPREHVRSALDPSHLQPALHVTHECLCPESQLAPGHPPIQPAQCFAQDPQVQAASALAGLPSPGANIALAACGDGVVPFKKKKKQIYPLVFQVLNLPPWRRSRVVGGRGWPRASSGLGLVACVAQCVCQSICIEWPAAVAALYRLSKTPICAFFSRKTSSHAPSSTDARATCNPQWRLQLTSCCRYTTWASTPLAGGRLAL